MNEPMKAVLKRQVRHVRSPFVFVDLEGNPYTDTRSRNNISRRTKAIRGKAGVQGGGFHLLRHTAASWLVQKGCPLTHVQAILGHTSPVMTMKYAHLMPGHLSGSMAALAEAMNGNMDPLKPEPMDTKGAMDTQVDTVTISADHAEAGLAQVAVGRAVS
jgi:integrase